MARRMHTRRAMSRTLPRTFAPLFASLLLAVGCGGSIETVSNGTDPGGGSSSGSSGHTDPDPGRGGGGSGGAHCDGRPECAPGDTKLATQEEACIEITGLSCYSKSACGETVWCQHTDAQCAAYPSCPAGYAEVKACVPDSDCKQVSLCGHTILCEAAPFPCEGPQPICDQGDTQVSSPSGCLQDDAKCYSRTSCDVTIWCTGPA